MNHCLAWVLSSSRASWISQEERTFVTSPFPQNTSRGSQNPSLQPCTVWLLVRRFFSPSPFMPFSHSRSIHSLMDQTLAECLLRAKPCSVHRRAGYMVIRSTGREWVGILNKLLEWLWEIKSDRSWSQGEGRSRQRAQGSSDFDVQRNLPRSLVKTWISGPHPKSLIL